MFELHLRELAISEIKSFIRSYEEGFFTLYRDSGIWAEELIIENYRQAARELSQRIFDGIQAHLVGKLVLGRKIKSNWLELGFYIGDRLITVYFSEDNKNKVRWVESVGIDRKPIIF